MNQRHRLRGIVLGLPDRRADLLGGADSPLGQLPHLVGHHGEPPPLLPRPGRLDGRIKYPPPEVGDL